MRTGLVLAVVATLAGPAHAASLPVEQVLVDGSKSLRGIWKIQVPGSAAYPDNDTFAEDQGEMDLPPQARGLKFGPPREQFCRIGGDDTMTIRCISFGRPGDGVVSSQGNQVSLSWGNPRLRLVLHGTLQSSERFDGRFTMEQERNRVSAPQTLMGEKVDLARTADTAGRGFMLKGVLAALSLGDTTLLASGAPDVAPPQDLPGLGKVLAVYDIGEAPLLRDAKLRPFFEVYAVEFANGERLCGLHQNPYGKIDGLRCV